MTDKPLDEALSTELATRISSKARAPFDNACKAALATQGAVYVQGFLAIATKPREPAEHAWIELEDRILDPSLPFLQSAADKLCYFPAQRLTVKQLKAILEESKEDYPDDDPLPVYGPMPYEYYGTLMLGGKDYQAAYEAALAKAKEFNRKIGDRN